MWRRRTHQYCVPLLEAASNAATAGAALAAGLAAGGLAGGSCLGSQDLGRPMALPLVYAPAHRGDSVPPWSDVAAKDREIAQLKAQLKAASAPAVGEGASDAEDPQGRLAEIASLLRALGSSTDPAIMGAREALSKEREAIKLRIVEAKPFAGQLHHYTTRIDALVQAKDKRQAALQDLQEQRKRLDDRITETEGQIAEITAEVQELEALRWKVSAKAPTAAPGECSLRALVPAVDISVEKMGEMLQGLGADDQLAQSVATVFSQLRALADKAAAAGPNGSARVKPEVHDTTNVVLDKAAFGLAYLVKFMLVFWLVKFWTDINLIYDILLKIGFHSGSIMAMTSDSLSYRIQRAITGFMVYGLRPHPRAEAALAEVGCARFPPRRQWARVKQLIDQASEGVTLAAAWDGVIATMEHEILNRNDIMDMTQRGLYHGRAGPDQWVWKRVQAVVPPRPKRLSAYQQYGKWCRHLRSTYTRMHTALQRIMDEADANRFPARLLPDIYGQHGHYVNSLGSLDQGLAKEQRLFAQLSRDLQGFFARVVRTDWVGPLLDYEDRLQLHSLRDRFYEPDFLDRIDQALDKVNRVTEAIRKFAGIEWAQWAKQAFQNGAGKAHRYTRVRELQETLQYAEKDRGQPHHMADECLEFWKGVWTIHDDTAVATPAGGASWLRCNGDEPRFILCGARACCPLLRMELELAGWTSIDDALAEAGMLPMSEWTRGKLTRLRKAELSSMCEACALGPGTGLKTVVLGALMELHEARFGGV
ncbi:unnamed protein product [Prorocentrum cordatum]|uniref:Uncharacterized protein n=1 Tax=Prorocentrum cordatum TaxID=2364126 RepID=A0ABN9U9T1_9DINO|nr:unnamed protein product [Polarella glacialis]